MRSNEFVLLCIRRLPVIPCVNLYKSNVKMPRMTTKASVITMNLTKCETESKHHQYSHDL